MTYSSSSTSKPSTHNSTSPSKTSQTKSKRSHEKVSHETTSKHPPPDSPGRQQISLLLQSIHPRAFKKGQLLLFHIILKLGLVHCRKSRKVRRKDHRGVKLLAWVRKGQLIPKLSQTFQPILRQRPLSESSTSSSSSSGSGSSSSSSSSFTGREDNVHLSLTTSMV